MSAGGEGSKRLGTSLQPRPREAEDAETAPPPPPTPPLTPPPTVHSPVHLEEAAESEGSTTTGMADSKPPRAAKHPHDHPLLIDAHEDRWRWRRKIREDPRKLFFYRICVALLGLLLIMLAGLTGPLPGPGGIPLAILGIAVWSSEFEWAQRLMVWFKAQLRRYQGWSRGRRVLFWAIFALCCGTLAYLVLLVIGVPFWVPEFAASWLRRLPGV